VGGDVQWAPIHWSFPKNSATWLPRRGTGQRAIGGANQTHRRRPKENMLSGWSRLNDTWPGASKGRTDRCTPKYRDSQGAKPRMVAWARRSAAGAVRSPRASRPSDKRTHRSYPKEDASDTWAAASIPTQAAIRTLNTRCRRPDTSLYSYVRQRPRGFERSRRTGRRLRHTDTSGSTDVISREGSARAARHAGKRIRRREPSDGAYVMRVGRTDRRSISAVARLRTCRSCIRHDGSRSRRADT
jgi:hypothetical protein